MSYSIRVIFLTFALCYPLLSSTASAQADTDLDGVPDSIDNCIDVHNPSQADFDGDQQGDACEVDPDGDGIGSENDNCPNFPNVQQRDHDGDGIGDPCDADAPQINDHDLDGIADEVDNCPWTYNPWQMDSDNDGIGDACEPGPTPTPTPTATPTPPPHQCPLYSVFRTEEHRASWTLWSMSTHYLRAVGRDLQCLRDLIDRTPTGWRRGPYGGESLLTQRLIEQACAIDSTPRFCSLPTAPIIGGPRGSIRNLTLYFDNQCNVVVNPPQSLIDSACEAVHIHNRFAGKSPISFIWEEGTDVEQDVTYVRFPLDPTSNNQWYEWKASAKAPLLVYDPEHLGEITSAAQLFGNWTFGGRRQAMLSGNYKQEVFQQKWDNGYQPLELLDHNGSGAIEGEELRPFALWFDRNRDGVSQDGEVEPVVDLDITKIYYRDVIADPDSGSFSILHGFDREINGQTISGRTVDWIGLGATSLAELRIKGAVEAAYCKEDQTLIQKPQDISKVINHPLNGFWEWKIVGEQQSEHGRGPKGLLVLNVGEDGRLYGESMTELPFKDSRNYQSVLKIAALRGEMKSGKGNGSTFRIVRDLPGDTWQTDATLRGGVLYGETLEKLSFEDSSTEVRYLWIANKVRGARASVEKTVTK